MVEQLRDRVDNDETAPPAPAERASDAELARMVAQTKHNPLFQALLDWIDGMVLVLNRQRQIVLANEEAARALGLEDPNTLVGMRYGEALGCLHAAEAPGGCGTGKACRYCGALRAVLASKRLDEPVDSECRITLDDGEGNEQTVKYRVRASKETRGEALFTVVVLQRADGGEPPAIAATVLDPVADWPVGIHSFARIRKLGTGGMGSVFLVEDSAEQQYALKAIRTLFADDETIADRFLKEIRLSIVLDHPNIVRTVRADQTEQGTLYMVTEYCPRGNTAQWLQRVGPIPVDLALHWMIGAARGLDYAWREHRLLHRDVKPDNLLVGAANEAKIADFGVAKRAHAHDSKLTTQGSVVGSIHYMAPEQALATDELDARADLYALGATLFELLTGQTPFNGPTPSAILSLKLTKPAPSLARTHPELPSGLTASIDRLLSTDAIDRPTVPAELLERLTSIAADERIDLDAVASRYEYPSSRSAR